MTAGTNDAEDTPDGATTPLHQTGTSLTPDQEVGYYIDMWKKSVEVQIHFNDIEWRIRSLALTAATFALGVAGVAAKDNTRVWFVSLGSLIILAGLILWYAFYFVDAHWYHSLLKASVAHGTEIERQIKETLPAAGVTASITQGSGYRTKGLVKLITGKDELRSEDKLKWFYRVGAGALIVAAIVLQVGAFIGPTGKSPSVPTPAPVSTSTAGP
ncbi:hypothetical protein GCM10011512_26030 [Tersicoccus solisilvae]|uniref:Uncharacterized protein n=1 Tax=Tersicoccus solisilvae TaxID=1882339 RepID=A0ABQ1PJ17_9MICC|nr:hypothetical protein [Tersicoccus solisilvae]GGC97867.1 hypothetical protein GCM10011512_26030 [Tersicoccus solisilvae]